MCAKRVTSVRSPRLGSPPGALHSALDHPWPKDAVWAMLGLRKALISGLATFLPGSSVCARKGLLRHAARVLLECCSDLPCLSPADEWCVVSTPCAPAVLSEAWGPRRERLLRLFHDDLPRPQLPLLLEFPPHRVLVGKLASSLRRLFRSFCPSLLFIFCDASGWPCFL